MTPTKPILWGAGLLIAGLIALLGLSQVALYKERAAHSESKSNHSLAVAASKSAALDQSEKYRQKEQDLHNAEATHAALVQTLSADLDRAARAARAAAGRVQLAAASAGARARAREGCAAPTAPGIRTPADDPIGVLIDVLARADERAGVLAEIADQRGLAGRACERSYDALYKSLTE